MNEYGPIPGSLVRHLAEPAARTRDAVADLGKELSTGRVVDAGQALRHDFSALGRIERDLAVHDSLEGSVEAGRRFAGRAGIALDVITADMTALRDMAAPVSPGGAFPEAATLNGPAEGALRQILTQLGASSDGRAVFAGGRADRGAVDDAQAVIDELAVATAGAATVDDVMVAVADYFAPGGGFETNGRAVAGPAGGVSFRIAEDLSASIDVGALDEDMRRMLTVVGQMATLSGNPLGDTDEGRARLGAGSAAPLSQAADAAIRLRARVGSVEAQLDTAAERLDADRYALMEKRNALIGVDQYETATRLEQETARLETVYTLTARLSRLRLTDYL